MCRTQVRTAAVHLARLIGPNLLAAFIVHALDRYAGLGEFPLWLAATRALVFAGLCTYLALIIGSVSSPVWKALQFLGGMAIGMLLLYGVTFTPNLLTLTPADALRKGGEHGMRVQVRGDMAGMVAGQSPAPGRLTIRVPPLNEIVVDSEENWEVRIIHPRHGELVDSECEVQGLGDMMSSKQLYLYLLIRRETESRCRVFGPVPPGTERTWQQPVAFAGGGGDRFDVEAWIVGDRQLPNEISTRDMVPRCQPNTRCMDAITVTRR